MSAVTDKRDYVLKILSTVEGISAYKDAAQPAQTPCVILGLPAFFYRGQCFEDGTPSELRWTCIVAVDNNDRAADVLFELVPRVVLAIESDARDVTVVRADPATFPVNGKPLPCYEIELGVTL